MTGGGKEVVAAEIEIGSKMVTLKKGMTTNIKPKLVIKYSDGTEQTISDVSKFRFVNMTSSVASVSKKGRVTALRTGTGYIYIVAEYGMFKKIQVKVVDKK